MNELISKLIFHIHLFVKFLVGVFDYVLLASDSNQLFSFNLSPSRLGNKTNNVPFFELFTMKSYAF